MGPCCRDVGFRHSRWSDVSAVGASGPSTQTGFSHEFPSSWKVGLGVVIGDHRRPALSQPRLHRSRLSSAPAAGASRSKLISARDFPGSWRVGIGVPRRLQSRNVGYKAGSFVGPYVS